MKTLKESLWLALLALLLSSLATAQEPGRYRSPEEAAKALRAAVGASGNSALSRVFGAEWESLLEEANSADVRESRRVLALIFEERWDIVDSEDGEKVLRLGLEGWPFPIPLVPKGPDWQFSIKGGLEELANRRIGRNELTAIETCYRIMDAEEDYRMRDPDGDGIRDFSSRIRSSPGERDGLYWETDDALPSPLQGALRDAWKYAEGRVENTPWFGYRFRFLDGQGTKARGGAYDYAINGHQIGGYALVAYPAKYGYSGIMTFVFNHNGTIYQKDLGEDSVAEAEAMTLFNPGTDWETVAEKL